MRTRGRGRVLAAAVAAAIAAAAPPRLAAQHTGAPSIRVVPAIAATPGSEAVLPIEVGPGGAIPPKSFLSVRGLPPTVGLHDGHSVGPGWWAVPLSALPALKVQIPDGLSGQSEIIVSLIGVDGQLLAQARSALVIQPAPQAAPADAPKARQELTDEERARAERLLARGEAYLANGNINSARDFFERAADAGLAAAALRLAVTYDETELKRLKVQGVAPDPALARKWYERARELGAAEAAEALARLGKS